MKDLNIHIPARRLRIEIWSLVVCFLIITALNIGAIITYHAPWTEIFTSIFYVITATILLYILWAIVRLVVFGTFRLFRAKHRK